MRKNVNKYDLELLFILAICLFVGFGCSMGKSVDNKLRSNFKNIPDTTKLSVYWYWINGNISKKGVTEDLISMHEVGIGRAFIGNIGLDDPHGDPNQEVKLLSKEWWDILGQVFRVADSLKIEIGIFNGPGWSQSGGPWVNPKYAMRYLKSEPLELKGRQKAEIPLKKVSEYFQRVAVVAFPTPKVDETVMDDYSPHISSNQRLKDIQNLIDNDTKTVGYFENLGQTSEIINLNFEKEITARSLLIYPAATHFKADMELQAEVDGIFKTIKKFEFNRSNPSKNVGFIPYAPVVVSLKATKNKHFRLIVSNRQGNKLAEITLTPRPYLDRFYEKQLARMYQTPLPLWDAYQWETQEDKYPESMRVKENSVIDLTSKVNEEGILKWNVPEGKWTILEYGMTPTGVTNAPATKEGIGLEVDKMSKAALKTHFEGFIGEILNHFSVNQRKAFKYVVADSYETGSETWTDSMEMMFKKRYRYDPVPWLPVLDGFIVGSPDQSDRFLWDLRRLIADNIAYQYVGGLRELSHQYGLKTWLENYGHWGFPAEFLQYGGQSDEVGGEFWAEGDLGSIELYAASSAADIYGKKKVYAESFTASGKAFERYPGYLKKRGDWSFTEGVNSTLLHVYISQPRDKPKPGINAWFGTEFNRNNTWFAMVKPYFDYLRRCNFLLQQGWPVKDVAYFIGEDAPKMTGIKEPALPHGYSFDYMNAEIIGNKLSVKDGKLVLPNGISYRILVLPPKNTMRPQVLKKIMELVKEGATILGPRPEHSPSLQNFPEADTQVKKMAEELWQNCDGKKVKMVKYGQGRVLNGMSMQVAFKLLKVVPDFEVQPGAPVLFTHRRADNIDIYFISNQSDSTIHIDPSFRVQGKQPEWWSAVDGVVSTLPQFIQKKHTTTVPMTLQAAQSGFIVFRKNTNKEEGEGNNFPAQKTICQIQGPWVVQFEKAMRGPAHTVTFPKLEDWKDNENDSIKYYSGTSVYETSFETSEKLKNAVYYLDLGNVGIMAEVILNGEKVGSVWTAPLEVNVTDALKKGDNRLKIRVANTWVNRLIGDSKLPELERKTYTDVNPYRTDSPLQSSGLIGPVSLKVTSSDLVKD